MVWPLLYRFKILWLSCAYLVPRFCVMSLVAREVSAWCRGCLGEALAYSCREMWSLYAKGVRSRIRACRAVGRMAINYFAVVDPLSLFFGLDVSERDVHKQRPELDKYRKQQEAEFEEHLHPVNKKARSQ